MNIIQRLDYTEKPRWAMNTLRRVRAITGRCPCLQGKSNCYGGEFGPCPYCACRRCNPVTIEAERGP